MAACGLSVPSPLPIRSILITSSSISWSLLIQRQSLPLWSSHKQTMLLMNPTHSLVLWLLCVCLFTLPPSWHNIFRGSITKCSLLFQGEIHDLSCNQVSYSKKIRKNHKRSYFSAFLSLEKT